MREQKYNFSRCCPILKMMNLARPSTIFKLRLRSKKLKLLKNTIIDSLLF